MPSKKTTPAMRRAERHLQDVLMHVKAHDLTDLQQRVYDSNDFTDDQQQALLYLLVSLQQIVKAEQLRDSGGGQEDMFAHLDEADIVAWQPPINQRPLF